MQRARVLAFVREGYRSATCGAATADAPLEGLPGPDEALSAVGRERDDGISDLAIATVVDRVKRTFAE